MLPIYIDVVAVTTIVTKYGSTEFILFKYKLFYHTYPCNNVGVSEDLHIGREKGKKTKRTTPYAYGCMSNITYQKTVNVCVPVCISSSGYCQCPGLGCIFFQSHRLCKASGFLQNTEVFKYPWLNHCIKYGYKYKYMIHEYRIIGYYIHAMHRHTYTVEK